MRFTPPKKARLEMTQKEATATLDALDSYKAAMLECGDNQAALAAGRVMGRLGVELARVGGGKLRSAGRQS